MGVGGWGGGAKCKTATKNYRVLQRKMTYKNRVRDFHIFNKKEM